MLLSLEVESSRTIHRQTISKSKGMIMRKGDRFIWHSCALVVGLTVCNLCGVPAVAQSTAARVLSNAVVNQPVLFDVAPALSTALKAASTAQGTRAIHAPLKPKATTLSRTDLIAF